MTRPIGRTVASHGLAAVGMSLPWPLLVLLVWERAGDGWLLGLTGAARMLPYVAISWWTARLADAVRRDLIVRVTLAVRAVLLTATALAVVAGLPWVAGTCCPVAASVATPAYPAMVAAMPGIAGRQRRRATDLLVTLEVGAFVVGVAIGGLLLRPQTRDLLPWIPVAFGFGVVLYFTAAREPSVWAGAGLSVVLVAAAIVARSRPLAFPVLIALAAIAIGFAVYAALLVWAVARVKEPSAAPIK